MPDNHRVVSEVLCSSLNELYILLFLSHHEISNACPIAISDLATALNIRPTTTLQAVKRLAESSFPLSTHDGWVLSRGGKITRMRSSPVISLETPLSDELVDLADLHDLSVPDRCDRMVILSFPLTPNETAVVDAVIRGLDVEQICDQLTLNPIPKRNRSMITRIIKRLSDQDTMNKRGISPLLQQHPLALHSSADQQQLEVHIKAISSLDL